MKTLVILQSSYIPWKGYFDLISRCDEFVFYDDTQFTRRDWRSRNRIKTAQGVKWLTVPVNSKGRYDQLINEVKVSDPLWAEQHWETIRHAYRQAPCFAEQEGWLRALYETVGRYEYLSRINFEMTIAISTFLGIRTKFSRSGSYPGTGRKTRRLIDICLECGATAYLSGPSAREYLETAAFSESGIELHFMTYEGYPLYSQLHGPVVHEVSIIDAIFNVGADARLTFRGAASH